MTLATTKYKHCNHHHEITDDQELVNIGGCDFVADKKMIPLLKALADLGIKTRTHNYHPQGSFISIILNDQMSLEVRKVFEKDANRTMFNGETELLIQFKEVEDGKESRI